jgi:hypothetical protein
MTILKKMASNNKQVSLMQLPPKNDPPKPLSSQLKLICPINGNREGIRLYESRHAMENLGNIWNS